MFYDDGFVCRSSIIGDKRIRHGFATRAGGVSKDPHTASMNTAVRMSDTPEEVNENIRRLAGYAGLEGFSVIYGKQVHSARVIPVDLSDAEISPEDRECDGYVTRSPGIALLVRAADCVPILFSGEISDGSPVIGAVHAGWRGTISGIAAEAVECMCSLGANRSGIRAAIGPSIRDCCFSVKDDFIQAVTDAAGSSFALRHIAKRDGVYYASLQSMNREILESAGVAAENIDESPDCTAHMSHKYHSHRATGGFRGAGGGIIGITSKNG